jgi:hypothetical protein
VASLEIEKNTVVITSPRMKTTIKMVKTNYNHPGKPRFDSMLGTGRTVTVITTASRIGLMIDAEPRTPNRITNTAAKPTK